MNAVLAQSMWEDVVLKPVLAESEEEAAAEAAENGVQWAVPPPDLAVAFNSGCGVDTDMWASVLLTLRSQVSLFNTLF